MASAAVCTVSTLPSVEARIDHDFGPRLPVAARSSSASTSSWLEAERQDDLVDTRRLQQAQMALEQAHAAELQQALGQLLRLPAGQTQSRARRQE